MDVPTASSSRARPRNRAALASLAAGLLGLLAPAAGIAAAEYSRRLSLIWGLAGAAIAGFLLGVVGFALSRRGEARVQWTLGRSRGARTARTGRLLAAASLCVAATVGLSLGFYALLELFAA
ncbi:MAG: hypothetical protein H0V84_02285 [Actinobacteria bacterium]|nr:hypothetical protein [Actinomycetota bacterium]